MWALVLTDVHAADAALTTHTVAEAVRPQQVLIVTTDFVPQRKYDQLAALAQDEGVAVQVVRTAQLVAGDAAAMLQQLEQADLLIAEGPRPSDLAAVQQALASLPFANTQPYLQIGAGPSLWRNLNAPLARRLSQYYQQGGSANYQALFKVWAQHARGEALVLPEVEAFPTQGVYHPDAPALFDGVAAYQAWYASRAATLGTVVFLVSPRHIADLYTELLDQLVHATEQQQLRPLLLCILIFKTMWERRFKLSDVAGQLLLAIKPRLLRQLAYTIPCVIYMR